MGLSLQQGVLLGRGVAKGTKGCGDCAFHGCRAGWVAPTPSQ